jgi:hypothetical protein
VFNILWHLGCFRETNRLTCYYLNGMMSHVFREYHLATGIIGHGQPDFFCWMAFCSLVSILFSLWILGLLIFVFLGISWNWSWHSCFVLMTSCFPVIINAHVKRIYWESVSNIFLLIKIQFWNMERLNAFLIVICVKNK